MPKFTRKKVVAGAATAVLAVGGGAAYAYWTVGGSGTGSADNATSDGSVTLHASFSNGLVPGASRTVTYTADNSGTSSAFVATITPSVSIDAAHSDCAASNFQIDPTDASTRVLGGATGVSVGTGTLTFVDSAANQDACKGATVTLNLTSN